MNGKKLWRRVRSWLLKFFDSDLVQLLFIERECLCLLLLCGVISNSKILGLITIVLESLRRLKYASELTYLPLTLLNRPTDPSKLLLKYLPSKLLSPRNNSKQTLFEHLWSSLSTEGFYLVCLALWRAIMNKLITTPLNMRQNQTKRCCFQGFIENCITFRVLIAYLTKFDWDFLIGFTLGFPTNFRRFYSQNVCLLSEEWRISGPVNKRNFPCYNHDPTTSPILVRRCVKQLAIFWGYN